jgi:DNA-dependent RNA polymerase auxiliary subunit epsilon
MLKRANRRKETKYVAFYISCCTLQRDELIQENFFNVHFILLIANSIVRYACNMVDFPVSIIVYCDVIPSNASVISRINC